MLIQAGTPNGAGAQGHGRAGARARRGRDAGTQGRWEVAMVVGVDAAGSEP